MFKINNIVKRKMIILQNNEKKGYLLSQSVKK